MPGATSLRAQVASFPPQDPTRIGATSGVFQDEFVFTETTGAGTYTGRLNLPAGATILDIRIRSTVLWAATTSATLNVGDTNSATGWWNGVNLKATDLPVGTELSFDIPGAKIGTYQSAAGIRSAAYKATPGNVIGVVVTVGGTGNTGVTRMMVMYAMPLITAATKV